MNIKKLAMALTVAATFGLVACNESSTSASTDDETPASSESVGSSETVASSESNAEDPASSESKGEEPASSEAGSEEGSSSESNEGSEVSSSSEINLPDVLDTLKNHQGEIKDTVSNHVTECSMDKSTDDAIVMTMTVDGVVTETKITIDGESMVTTVTTEGANEAQMAEACDKAKAEAAAQGATVTCNGNSIVSTSPAMPGMGLDVMKPIMEMTCAAANGDDSAFGDLFGGLGEN